MAKLLRGACRGLGNFSIFPDELLIYIISLLPFKDAVRTSILSTKWRHLYASISNIHFNFEDDGTRRNLTGFQKVVGKLFDLRSSSRCLVDKFSLSESVLRDLDGMHLHRWIQSLMWHGVRELDIFADHAVIVPSSLCTCKTLEVLKLAMPPGIEEFRYRYPRFQLPAKISLPSLKVLYLVGVGFADDEAVNRLISDCPVLEKFVFHLWDDHCKLSVSNTTLKYLVIQHLCSERWSGSFDIVINAPNINFLQYSVSGVTSQTFVFGPALTSVTYDLRLFEDRQFVGRRFGGRIKYSQYSRSATNLIWSIKEIESLRIGAELLEELQEFNIPLPIFKKLRHLAIDFCAFGLFSLPHFLVRCESLEHIEFLDNCVWNPAPNLWIPPEEPRISCLTSHLKTIEFFEFKPEENQIEVVKYFLESARVLKTVKLHLCGDVDANSEMVKELPMLPRISEECKVVVFQCCQESQKNAKLLFTREYIRS